MKEIKKLNEFYSERVNEVQLKLDHVYENLDETEIAEGLFQFLKIMDEDVEGIYEDSIDFLIETKINSTEPIQEIDELSSDDENPSFIKKFEES